MNSHRPFSDEQDRVIEYRPVSAIAILAVVVSLFSFLSLGSVILNIIPMVAIGLALAALLRARMSGTEYLGISMAWVAMFIACCCMAASITYHTTRSNARWTTARQYAEQWLQLIQQGEKGKVHQLTLANNDRQDPNIDLEIYYALENRAPRMELGSRRQPQTEFESYWGNLLPQKLILDDGDQGRIEFVRQGEIQELPDGELYELFFHYYPADDTIKERVIGENRQKIRFDPLEFLIKMKRSKQDQPIGVQWEVMLVKIDGVRQPHYGASFEK